MGRLQSAPCAARVPCSATCGAVRAGGRRRASARRLILLFVLAPVVLAAVGRATAQACVEVPITWPLKPSAIGRGDSFRLLFITSGTLAPGSREDIGFYNQYVRTYAGFGHLSFRRYTNKFRVLGSTATVDARDNTGTTGTGVPIYWVNGHKVADNYADFYDGSWDSFIARNEDGELIYRLQNVHVWTGSTSDGREYIDHFNVSRALGKRSIVIGRPYYGNVLNSGGRSFENDNAKHLYGLSDVFCIPSRVRLSWSPDTVDEGAGARPVTVTATMIDAARSRDTTIRVSVGSDTATEGTDFDEVADFDLMVTAGQTSGSASFDLTPVDDTLEEDDETLSIAGAADELEIRTASGQGPLTIRDDDFPRVELSWSPATLDEGAGARQVAVTATLAGATRTRDTTVRVSVGSGTATEGTDFAEVEDFDLTVAAGQTSDGATFTLTPLDDTLDEDDETVSVIGAAAGLQVRTASGQDPLTIRDDDTARVELSWSPSTLDEGAGARQIEVTATLVGATRLEDTTIRVSVGSDTATEGTDFEEVADFDLTVTAGESSSSAAFTLIPLDDTLEESDETVAIAGAAGGLEVGTASGQGPLTIQDDDTTLGLTLSWLPGTLDEGAGAQEIAVTATLVGATRLENTTVRVSVGSDTATEGTDFDPVEDFDLTVTAGQISGNAAFTLAPVDDTLDEDDETVAISGAADGLAVGTASGQGPLTIQDDDTARVELSWAPSTLDEGAGAREIAVTATLAGATRSEDTTVRVAVGSGTAMEGTDFAAIEDFDLTVTAGQTSGSAAFTLTPVDDTLEEDDETVAISGVAGDLAVGTASGQGPLTIQDDDTTLGLTLSWSPDTLDEGAGARPVAVTATLVGATRTQDTTVRVAVGSDTAIEGTDFEEVADFDLTVAAGQSSGDATFTLTPVDDTLDEDDETVSIAGTADGLEVGTASGQGPLTIQDDDTAPVGIPLTPRTLDEGAFSVADAEVQEGQGATLPFVVTLSRSRTVASTVAYATRDGTATAGLDYVAARGTLTFPAGETSRTLRISVLDDAFEEPRETMTLTLSNPSPGTRIDDGVATGTIDNQDTMMQIWITRFGRMVGSQIVEALVDRFDRGGSHVTMGDTPVRGSLESAGPRAPDLDSWPGEIGENDPERRTRAATMRRLLRGSSFLAALDEHSGRSAASAAWGSVAGGRFDARPDGVDLDGEVVTGLIGVDMGLAGALAGVVVSHSEGEGAYSARTDMASRRGTLHGVLTGAHPYFRFPIGERSSAWGVAGSSWGKLVLRPEGMTAFHTDLTMQMGAVGLDGAISERSEPRGTELTIRSDAMWMRIATRATAGLRRAEGEATRIRLILAGERDIRVDDGATFTPSAEIGLRHDGGDADDGTGVEIGAGMRYSVGRVSIAGSARTLAVSGRNGYEEWGARGAIHVGPDASGRGVSFTLAPVWGPASSGSERLWSARDAAAAATGSRGRPEGRLDAELGHGLPALGSRFTMTPKVRFGLSRTTREFSLGWTLSPVRRDRTSFDLGLEATRREAANDSTHELMLRFTLLW